MLGEKGFELIKELQRIRHDDCKLPPFNDEILRRVLEEIRALHGQSADDSDDLSGLTGGPGHLASALLIRNGAIERNQRCVLTYLHRRLQHARALRWELGSVLPPEARSGLSDAELSWFGDYNRVLARYMKSIGDGGLYGGLDLTQHKRPPKSLYIEVRCLVDYGELELEDGNVVILKKNHQHFLPRDVCERLVSQGVLQHIPTP